MAGSAFNPGNWKRVAAGAVLSSGAVAVAWWAIGVSPSGIVPANYFISTTGNNASAGTTAGAAWLTFQKAYTTATDGTTIEVAPGDYPSDASLGGSDRYIDSAVTHTVAVTFKCKAGAANDSVTFDTAYWFDIRKANGVTFQGRCFRFNAFKTGESGDTGAVCANVTADNVHMSTFENRGCTNETIQNSEVGPSVACAAPSSYAGVDPRECTNVWPESLGYVNDRSLQSNYGYGEAQVGSNSTASQHASGFVFYNNYLHDFQGRDTNGLGGHEGCIQFNDTGDYGATVIRANTFERCAVLGILFDNAGAAANDVGYSNITIENNDFGAVVEPYDAGASNPSLLCCLEAASSQRDVIFKAERTSQAITLSNILVRYNSFTHGMTFNHLGITQSYSSVRAIGNVMGQASTCETGAGLTYDRDVWPTGHATCNSEANAATVTWTASVPYQQYSEGSALSSTPVANFTLANGQSFLDWITEATSDYAITTDRNGVTRPVGAGREPGAHER